MAGVTEYLSGGMWSRPLQWVETASSLFTLESSATVHVSVRAVPANRGADRLRETDTAGGGTEKGGREGEGEIKTKQLEMKLTLYIDEFLRTLPWSQCSDIGCDGYEGECTGVCARVRGSERRESERESVS